MHLTHTHTTQTQLTQAKHPTHTHTTLSNKPNAYTSNTEKQLLNTDTLSYIDSVSYTYTLIHSSHTGMQYLSLSLSLSFYPYPTACTGTVGSGKHNSILMQGHC